MMMMIIIMMTDETTASSSIYFPRSRCLFVYYLILIQRVVAHSPRPSPGPVIVDTFGYPSPALPPVHVHIIYE